jgi:hypothetical protein
MHTGKLNSIILIQTLSESTSSGDVTQSWSAGVTVRAAATQIDGTRYLKDDELVDKGLFKFELWDNSYSENIRIVYEGKTLYPIRPITRNPGRGSMLCEIVILAAAKLGTTTQITTTSITADSTTVTADDTTVTADHT